MISKCSEMWLETVCKPSAEAIILIKLINICLFIVEHISRGSEYTPLSLQIDTW